MRQPIPLPFFAAAVARSSLLFTPISDRYLLLPGSLLRSAWGLARSRPEPQSCSKPFWRMTGSKRTQAGSQCFASQQLLYPRSFQSQLGSHGSPEITHPSVAGARARLGHRPAQIGIFAAKGHLCQWPRQIANRPCFVSLYYQIASGSTLLDSVWQDSPCPRDDCRLANLRRFGSYLWQSYGAPRRKLSLVGTSLAQTQYAALATWLCSSHMLLLVPVLRRSVVQLSPFARAGDAAEALCRLLRNLQVSPRVQGACSVATDCN